VENKITLTEVFQIPVVQPSHNLSTSKILTP